MMLFASNVVGVWMPHLVNGLVTSKHIAVTWHGKNGDGIGVLLT